MARPRRADRLAGGGSSAVGRVEAGPFCRLGAVAMAAACALASCGQPLGAQWRGAVAFEGRAFPSNWSEGPELGLLLTARGAVDLGDGISRLTIEPFVLLDLNGDRGLFDFSELAWTATWDRWEVAVGSRIVAWGVTESAQPVDVINQRFPRSTAQGHVRLGQPMVSGAWFTGSGAVEAFVLPGFRERRFSGRAGRIWSELEVDDASSAGGSRSGRHVVDWAVRWSHAAGEWDLAVSHFSGRTREPHFDEIGAEGLQVARPVYPLVDQTGIELQWTRAAWLLKLEALARSGGPGRHEAVAGGVEYAFADHLSGFIEYAADTRGARATTSLEHDAFIGGRLVTHEGEIEAGLVLDTSSGNRIARVTARRRLGERLSVELGARGFWGDAGREPPQALVQESFLSLRIRAAF